MKPSFPFDRFVRYRFDYASLVVDSIRAFASNEFRTSARLVAALFLATLVAPPLITLIAAREPFSADLLFVVLFILWPWVLEFPAWTIRQIQADAIFGKHYSKRSNAYDWFMHVFFGLVALTAIGFLVLDAQDLNKTELAALWAVALAGGADMVRSVAAYALAELRGFPLYGAESRK